MANKIKRKLRGAKERKKLVAEGVLSIQAGLNPRVLEEKLRGLCRHHAPPKSRTRAQRAAEGRQWPRSKKHEEHENHERWLVSYADFITLLFAFFVVLYSISRVDNKRMAQVQQSIKFAMHFKGTGGIDQLPMFEGPPVDGGKCWRESGFDEHPRPSGARRPRRRASASRRS